MESAELFAGCGGLAMGMARVGFRHTFLAEFNDDAVATVLHNKERGVEHVRDWPIERQDVREVDWKAHQTLELLSGGPPCQPFGIGGKKQGHKDHRDMWPEAIRAIREAKPRLFLFENVRNIAGPKFRSYLQWIVYSLERPSNLRKDGETQIQHALRLRSSRAKQEYRVSWQVVNAADYGAAQIRHRVLIFGLRSDVGVAPFDMSPTHSRDRLLWDQYVTGEYWKRHGLKKRKPSEQDAARVDALKKGDEPETLPWVTVRDAIAGLGEPNGKRNHVFQPGARVYPGHTGSPLDLPAKALKAGDHGVPGGENMMVKDDGTVRYFTTREAARLVGLPDDYEFPRSWSESMRQLGNAVPAQLGTAAGSWLLKLAAGEALPLELERRSA
ncbi:DNA cytosine methyltransferase [Bradyrhizobium diazoefficiens]|uniref:DNA cytosine methyltransferase n=1 Tax=Bradyrhizobium diazoefficiens TaxID=1355477 RepID=UPI0005771B61|nr:DNA cytosine methyltransferase [Bradyrhizobium diazoefficiens]